MIVCNCGKKIEYFIAIAHDIQSSLNPGNRPIIHHSFFVCNECTEKVMKEWEDHNKDRNEPYLIQKAKVNVSADTKKEFIRRATPQLFSQFSKANWWLPKLDIQATVQGLKKN